eukprot:scpid27874/ scgid5069/ Metabotropic glutamate receptor 3
MASWQRSGYQGDGHLRIAVHVQVILVALLCTWPGNRLASAAVGNFFGPCTTNCTTRNGEVVFGGFFPLYEWSYKNNSCSAKFRPESGFQRLEAMRWAVERYTSYSNVSVGYDLRDSCSKDTNTRDEALDYINVGTNCQARYRDRPISLVIGSASSEVSSDLASLLALFDVPQISYASTSNEMNKTASRDQSRFDKFYRTVPPDRYQVDAMMSLIERFNWSFVRVVYGSDPYGQAAYNWFRKRVSAENVSFCLAQPIAITINDNVDANVKKGAEELNKGYSGNATVIIVFAQSFIVRQFLSEAKTVLASEGLSLADFTWIASDSWSNSVPLVWEFPQLANHLISFQPYTEVDSEFETHLGGTQLKNFPSGARGAWYRSYFKYLFPEGYNASTRARESARFNVDAKVPFVIQAVQIGLQAVEATLRKKCSAASSTGALCADALETGRPVVGDDLSMVLSTSQFNTSFDSSRIFKFETDSRSFLPLTASNMSVYRYSIYHYRKAETLGSGPVAIFEKVGNWSNTEDLMIGDDFEASFRSVISICSNPCEPGAVEEVVTGESRKCCWSCKKCKSPEIANNITGTCKACDEKQTSNAMNTACVDLEPVYLKWDSPYAVVMLVICALTFIITTLTIVVFAKHWETPLVRASSRELSICLFIGFYLGMIVTVVHITKPTVATCIIRRFGLGFSLSLCLSALLVKTNRISRVFNRDPGRPRPAYVAPEWQIFFTAALTLVQVLICTVWLVVQPAVSEVDVSRPNIEVQLKCDLARSAGFYVSLLYVLVLMLIVTIYGVRTRKIPENFNEARYISFSMYTMCTVWVGTIPTYFGVKVGFESGLLGLPLIISIFAMVGFLFVPKLYVILFDSERNNRRNFVAQSGSGSNSAAARKRSTPSGGKTGTGSNNHSSGNDRALGGGSAGRERQGASHASKNTSQ